MKTRPNFDGFAAPPAQTDDSASPDFAPDEIDCIQATIRAANDKFRQSFVGGEIFSTPGIRALGTEANLEILEQIRNFSDFNPNNDPHGEHDFGSFEQNGEKIFWKIDYYDTELNGGSPDPSDPLCTRRVMTIMLASEY